MEKIIKIVSFLLLMLWLVIGVACAIVKVNASSEQERLSTLDEVTERAKNNTVSMMHTTHKERAHSMDTTRLMKARVFKRDKESNSYLLEDVTGNLWAVKGEEKEWNGELIVEFNTMGTRVIEDDRIVRVWRLAH